MCLFAVYTQLLIRFLHFTINTGETLTSIFYRIHCEKISAEAKVVWANQEISGDIASDALQILAKASKQNLRFFCGKQPKCILGGLFYILGFRFRAVKTQREIADLLGITEVSIRKSYKNWLKEFPKYFTDVNDKILEHNCTNLIVCENNLPVCELT